MDPEKFNGRDDTWREEICHFLFHDNFVFCLLCKTDIEETDVNCHIMESNHQQSKQKLFSNCINDPFSDSVDFRFAEVVSNAKSDVGQLLTDCNRQSYVYQSGESLICLFCEEPISSTTSADQMKSDLELHLGAQNHSHMQNMNDRVSWAYCLNKANAFILFSKALVYCSVCDQILDYVNNLKLFAVVGHLQTSQHRTKLEQTQLTEKLSDSFDTQLTQNIDGNLLNAPVDLSVSDSDSSEYDSACEEISEFLDDNALTCPECGDVIEIFNDNADLSLEFHLQKHKDLSVVNASFRCEYQEDADYMCPVCMDAIAIFNKDVELSFKRHFEEKRHDMPERAQVNEHSPGLLSSVFSNFLRELEVHQTYFTVSENTLVCKLCSCTVQKVSKDLMTTSQTLRCHISESYHSDQHKLATQQMAHAVLSYNKELTQQVPTRDDKFEKLASQNSIINKNRRFIEKQKIHYLCKICQKHICYSPKDNTQVFNFMLHFNSPLHKANMKKVMPSKKKVLPYNHANHLSNHTGITSSQMRIFMSYNKIIQHISTRFPQIYEDLNYLQLSRSNISNVYCNLCKVFVKLSMKGAYIKKHCKSESHVAKARYSQPVENIPAQAHNAENVLEQNIRAAESCLYNLHSRRFSSFEH